MSEAAKWYVIHTYSGYENKVADNIMTIVRNRNLDDLILEIRIPTEMVTKIGDGGKSKEVERKVYPGYVMIRMIVTNESWFAVRNVRGVTGFVGASSTAPVPLTDKEVESMGVFKEKTEVNYKIGDNVKIVSGPLEDYMGIVEELDTEKNYVKVMISMFGRETPAELELDQIEIA